jgi:hypothetical protein
VLPLAARTATPNVQQFNFDCNGLDRDGLIVLVNVTALTATGTLTVKIEGVDPNTGAAYTILTSAALAATGVVVLRVHPNLPASANVTAQDMVPPVFQVTATHGNGVSITYGITVLIGG